MNKSKVLVTGGAGYIGSHILVELINKNYIPIVIDNLSNSSEESVNRVTKITNRDIKFYNIDVRDTDKVETIMKLEKVDAVIHCAGLKSVRDSESNPLEYYSNNIGGALSVIKAMKLTRVSTIIFSSSATVYGNPQSGDLPLVESKPRGKCSNPYGWTKSMIEQILEDISESDKNFRSILLRYFNPVGAHQSGLIGEDPKELNNLMPYITQVALKHRDILNIYGGTYDTPDGTCIRDYMHVVDLAKGHVSVLDNLQKLRKVEIINLGTGKGYSVKEVVRTFSEVNHVDIPFVIAKRRRGDVPILYSNSDKAYTLLNWKCEYNLEDMCKDSWNWQKLNPNGYRGI